MDTKNDSVLTALIANLKCIKIQDSEVTIEQNEPHEQNRTVPNENVAMNQNISNEMKEEHELQFTNDKKNATLDPKDNGQSESNEDTSSEGKIIRQHKFYIHSTWLAVQSSYFRSLFFSGMKESSAKEVHVQITTNEEQAHLMLLEATYKIDTLDSARVDELLEVLRLAHKYDVKFVFKKCKYVLQDMVDSLEICEQIMHFIKVENTVTDVEDLAGTLQSFLAKEFSPLDETWQTTSFTDLCEPSLKYLLSSDELVTVSENTVFQALMHWIEERGIENVIESREMPSLLSVVRFELIPVDYLYNIVQHHSVAKKLPDFNDHYLRGISYHAMSEDIRKHLASQPVKRKPHTSNFVPYTWVIPRHKLDALVGTKNKITSHIFWYCGYKVVLTINHVNQANTKIIIDKGVKKETFSAELSLAIINLKQHSDVKISWEPNSEDLTSHYYYSTTHAFQKYAPASTIAVQYRMEVKQKVFSAGAKSTISTTAGFGFSTPPAATNFAPSFNFKNTPSEEPTLEIPDVPCLSIGIRMNLA